MGRIGEGVDETDGDGAHVRLPQSRHRGADVVLVQGLAHRAVGVDALAHLEAKVAGDQGRRAVDDQL